ncbi:amidase family protein [Rhodopseudomonas palustris]|uniref:amidase family protein n=1 Tax=Rhodopseudomonas palustris TaxID=1076 RepID=UPI0021F3B7CF|nr:amidase family protein [Rhodopseudomonas palustris]UYO51495.1 amidase [Rhodopseudomonas palustris]
MNISSCTEVVVKAAFSADAVAVERLSVAQLHAAYRGGRLSPVEVANVLLVRLAQAQAAVNAFMPVDSSQTLAMARASEARWRAGTPIGPLDGVPVTIKDLVAVKDWPLLRGSESRVGESPPTEDAASVARLREAGCVFLGKTTTPDSGSRITTESVVHGVSTNPYDVDRTPGGSSGGAGAALALGVGPLALGTDGAGSIRIPAAWCGIFGLKPSFGRVPTAKFDIDMPFSVIGPMARSVDDAAYMLETMAKPDTNDAFALAAPFRLSEAMRSDAVGLRVGITMDFGNPTWPVEAEIADAVRRAADVLSNAGADVRPVDVRWPNAPLPTFNVFWEALYAGALALMPQSQRMRMDPGLLAIADRGTRFSAIDFLVALNGRLAMTAAAHELFSSVDVLIGPVMPCTAPLVANNAPPGGTEGNWDWCPFTFLWNMTGQPASSVPMGVDRHGIPIGVQVVGAMAQDETVLRVSRVLELSAPGRIQPGLFDQLSGVAGGG